MFGHPGPLNVLQAADLQLGAIDQIAPVTTKTLILNAGASMTFRRIPAGAFIMGSATGYPDETPRAVRIDKPFWLSEMEVVFNEILFYMILNITMTPSPI